MCALGLLHAEDGIEKARNSSRVINQIIKKVKSKAIISEPAPGDVVPSGNLYSSEVKCVVTSILKSLKFNLQQKWLTKDSDRLRLQPLVWHFLFLRIRCLEPRNSMEKGF